MAAEGLHISISAEKLFSIGSLDVSNSIATSVIVSLLLILFALLVRLSLDKNAIKPGKLQNFAEWIVESFYGLVYGVTGDHVKARFFAPFIMSFFLFILMNNWLGLLPGVGTIGFMHTTEESQEHSLNLIETAHASVEEADHIVADEDHAQEEESHSSFVPFFRAGTADINTTLALALISVFLTQFIGVKYLKLSYFKKFINFSNPILFFVGLLEIISEFAKIISFAFRLFGNIFAGEVLLAVISFLVPVIAPMPFYGLEVFVGFIQALVFALLSLVFFNMASVSHDDH